MFIGFDYGTSSCSVAHMKEGTPSPILLEGDNVYIPSTLAAPTREAVTESLYRFYNIAPGTPNERASLRRAVALNQEEGIELVADDISFGQAALQQYLADPEFTYYVKSPKSFLGSTGLRDAQLQFFEDLVCAMMANIKQRSEQALQIEIEDTVIGRPIHFQGRGGMQADQQAEAILLNAAQRVGFKNIEFQFEPVAAGLEFEASLTEDKIVLIVDIGGGTTDCSMLQMGPSYRHQQDRTLSILGHTGQRVGGNDLDIHFAFRQLMPEFGFGSLMRSGLEMPITQFWNPVAINDVPAQTDFYSQANTKHLEALYKNAQEPEKLMRWLQLQQSILGHGVVRRAEEAKIALSQHRKMQSRLDFLKQEVIVDLTQEAMIEAIQAPKLKMMKLVEEAMVQSGVTPDVIYMTGGSAKSPILRQAVADLIPNIAVVGGDDFGSVTAGLARWAQTCFGVSNN
ncbi:MAG: molecular chaperone [Vibrio sp.]